MVEKIGSPDYLTPETMQFLYEKSKMPESEKALFADKVTGAYGFSETLCPGDVKLIQISNI